MYVLRLRTTACIPNQIPRERIAAGGLRFSSGETRDSDLLRRRPIPVVLTRSVIHRSHKLGRPGGPPSRDPLPV
jgi:hypothetical protein